MKKLIPLIATIGALVLAGCNQSSNQPGSTSTPSGNGTMANTNTSNMAATNSAPAQ